jgi:hypothetical protein
MKRPILAALALAAAVAAPATASAASIELATNDDGSRVIAYKAKSGEVNALKMYGTVDPFDLRMTFFEYSSRLTPGAGCASRFPVICGASDTAFPVEVSLGDRGDVANVNSFTERLTLDAGSGDDDVLAGGFDATAEGGSGNDTIRVAANSGTRGNGGSGRDRITGGLGAVAAILDGGSGNDLVVPDGSIFNDAKGGSGNDQLVAFRGREIRLSGGDGDDALIALSGRGPILLDGGDDDDFVFSHAGSVTANAGSGIDIVDVQGGPDTAADTVSCGSGWDVAWVDEADVVDADCELRFRSAPPAFRKVATAEAAAQALLAHDPDPSQR